MCVHVCACTRTIFTLSMQCQTFPGMLKAICFCPLVSRCPRMVLASGDCEPCCDLDVTSDQNGGQSCMSSRVTRLRGWDCASALPRGQKQPKQVGHFLYVLPSGGPPRSGSSFAPSKGHKRGRLGSFLAVSSLLSSTPLPARPFSLLKNNVQFFEMPEI